MHVHYPRCFTSCVNPALRPPPRSKKGMRGRGRDRVKRGEIGSVEKKVRRPHAEWRRRRGDQEKKGAGEERSRRRSANQPTHFESLPTNVDEPLQSGKRVKCSYLLQLNGGVIKHSFDCRVLRCPEHPLIPSPLLPPPSPASPPPQPLGDNTI